MINVHDNYWIPSEGYKYITNGEIFSNGIYLGINDSPDNWRDTNEEPESEGDAEEILDIILGGAE